jgi:uncharacterized protein YjbK
MPLETELKYAIRSREDYEKLRSRLSPAGEPVVQINHYFSGRPDGPLARGRAMLRLRQAEGGFVLAFKGGLRIRDDHFSSTEIEVPLDGEKAEAALREGLDAGLPLDPVSAAAALDPTPVFRAAGSSKTLRIRAPLPTGDTAELDRCSFPGGAEDFELEVETRDPEPVRRLVASLARELGLVLRPQSRTKYRRFLEASGNSGHPAPDSV